MYKRFVYYDDCHDEYEECFVDIEKNEEFVKEMENLLGNDETYVGADRPLFIDNKFIFDTLQSVKDYIAKRQLFMYFIEANVSSGVFDDVIEFECEAVNNLIKIEDYDDRMESDEMCNFGIFMYDNVFRKSDRKKIFG